MDRVEIASSRLPSFLLPCPHCGHRMKITAIAPLWDANGIDLEDITHSCVQCGSTLISTRCRMQAAF
jgi:predicted RNA-binding Zn-ribbon protein involved in translation (DUF1610 family)